MSDRLTRRAFVRRAVMLTWAASVSSTGISFSEEGRTYTVQKGDTVWEIARKYGVKPEDIIAANGLDKSASIFPGKVLTIPRVSSSSGTALPVAESGAIHTVQKGESIWGISKKHGVTPDAIIAANQLTKPYIIHPGQQLIIPGSLARQARQQEMASLCRLPRGVRPRKWRYIIIHHSGTAAGNAAIFDRSHRRRRMENGLAYHFVIGNGRGSGDGEIEVGGRWTRQLHGGHVRSRRMNNVAIGVCLVGNFERTYPTKKQMESVTQLVRYLSGQYNIPKKRVVGHRDVQQTDCPGKHFSLTRLTGNL